MPVTLSAACADKKLPTRPSDPDLLSRQEAATHLGVSVSSLAHWAMTGHGPTFIKLGRKTWYRRSGLDAWIETQVPVHMRVGR